MSAEHFETVLKVDVRTKADGQTVEYAPAGSGYPRWPDVRDGWVACYLYAEQVLRIAADTVAQDPMDGLSGDLPRHRASLARIIQQTADLTRYLAADDAFDGTVEDAGWQRLVRVLQGELNAALQLTTEASDAS